MKMRNEDNKEHLLIAEDAVEQAHDQSVQSDLELRVHVVLHKLQQHVWRERMRMREEWEKNENERKNERKNERRMREEWEKEWEKNERRVREPSTQQMGGMSLSPVFPEIPEFSVFRERCSGALQLIREPEKRENSLDYQREEIWVWTDLERERVFISEPNPFWDNK
jgi:hypothetical protein